MLSKKWFNLLNILVLFSVVSFSAHAVEPIYTATFSNVAIKGYDPVAYFTDNAPVQGSETYQYPWQGAVWYFSSAKNLALFKANPEQYAPQYGGYCAYAVANGKTAKIDPSQFSIVDGKLYLNYNAKIQSRWLEQRDHYIGLADRHWPAILAK